MRSKEMLVLLHKKRQTIATTTQSSDAGTRRQSRSLAAWLYLQMREWCDINQERNIIAAAIDDVDGVLCLRNLP